MPVSPNARPSHPGPVLMSDRPGGEQLACRSFPGARFSTHRLLAVAVRVETTVGHGAAARGPAVCRGHPVGAVAHPQRRAAAVPVTGRTAPRLEDGQREGIGHSEGHGRGCKAEDGGGEGGETHFLGWCGIVRAEVVMDVVTRTSCDADVRSRALFMLASRRVHRLTRKPS